MSSRAPLSKYLIRMAGIVPESYVDGPGVRYTLFVQGCPHHCPGCHNSDTWDFFGGTVLTADELLEKIGLAKEDNPYLQGVTISGGEPFCQASSLTFVASKLAQLNLDLVVYTGYTIEELPKVPNALELLPYVDILIDGRFQRENKSLTLPFRGSSNQRLLSKIQINEFLKNNGVEVKATAGSNS